MVPHATEEPRLWPTPAYRAAGAAQPGNEAEAPPRDCGASPRDATNPAKELKEQELARLSARAQQGDQAVLPELRRFLDANESYWQQYGDLAQHAEASLGILATHSNLVMAESLKRKLAAMKQELAAPSSSPLEQLLIARVVATWLQTAYYDGLVAQNRNLNETQTRMLQRNQDAAQRRHLTAIKMLATVRKLLRPVPTPWEMLQTPVGEAATFGGRSRAGNPQKCGAGVEN